jgi:CBS domain-containing protein
MKVKEIMTREIKSISPDLNGREALDLLLKMKISGLPVIDKARRLVGMFTEKEVLSYVLPSYIGKVGKFIYEENPKSTRRKFAELKNVTVEKLMRKEVVTIAEDVTLCEAARVMLTQRARRVPVVGKDGKVLGMVAREDVLKGIEREGETQGSEAAR